MKISNQIREWLGSIIRSSVEEAIQTAVRSAVEAQQKQPQSTAIEQTTKQNNQPLLPRIFPGIQFADYTGWIGLFFALLPVAISTLRLLFVARFDINNAVILASNINLTAMFIAALPSVWLAALAGAYIILMVYSTEIRWWAAATATGIYLLIAFLFIKLSSYIIVIITLVFGILLYRAIKSWAASADRANRVYVKLSDEEKIEFLTPLGDGYYEDSRGRLVHDLAPMLRRLIRAFFLTITAVSLIGGGLEGQAWLPREVVYLKIDGPREVHVLNATDHDMTLLSVDLKSVYVVRQDDVTGRRICKEKEPALLGKSNVTGVSLAFGLRDRSLVGEC